jgi:hypothetical protein
VVVWEKRRRPHVAVRERRRRPHVAVRESVKQNRDDLQTQKAMATQLGWVTQDQEVHRETHKRLGCLEKTFPQKGKLCSSKMT